MVGLRASSEAGVDAGSVACVAPHLHHLGPGCDVVEELDASVRGGVVRDDKTPTVDSFETAIEALNKARKVLPAVVGDHNDRQAGRGISNH